MLPAFYRLFEKFTSPPPREHVKKVTLQKEKYKKKIFKSHTETLNFILNRIINIFSIIETICNIFTPNLQTFHS